MTRIVLDVHNIWYVGPFIQAASMKLDHSNASELTVSESYQFDFTRNFSCYCLSVHPSILPSVCVCFCLCFHPCVRKVNTVSAVVSQYITNKSFLIYAFLVTLSPLSSMRQEGAKILVLHYLAKGN